MRITAHLAVLLALCLPAPISAQTTGLISLEDRGALLGWEAVGRLDLATGGYCTGTLIAPDLVLTAAHCVVDAQTGQQFAPSDIRFRAGLRNGVSITDRLGAQIAVDPRYSPASQSRGDSIRHDLAIVRLDAPISSSDADPFAVHTDPERVQTVSVTSYGKGRDEALSRQRQCNLLYRYNDLIAFDCDVTFGSSGAPVFAHEGGRGRILSIVSAGRRDDGEVLAFGMELPDAVARLKAQLRATRASPTAVIRRVQVGATRTDTGAKFVRP